MLEQLLFTLKVSCFGAYLMSFVSNTAMSRFAPLNMAAASNWGKTCFFLAVASPSVLYIWFPSFLSCFFVCLLLTRVLLSRLPDSNTYDWWMFFVFETVVYPAMMIMAAAQRGQIALNFFPDVASTMALSLGVQITLAELYVLVTGVGIYDHIGVSAATGRVYMGISMVVLPLLCYPLLAVLERMPTLQIADQMVPLF